MKKFLFIILIISTINSFAKTPTIDGYIEPEEYDLLLATGDHLPASFSIANAKELFFAEDKDNYYLAARMTTDATLTWAITINTQIGTGGSSDPRPKQISFGYYDRPDILLCGTFSTLDQNYRIYRTATWNAPFTNSKAIFKHNVYGFTDIGEIEIVIPKSLFGTFSLFETQFYLSGTHPYNSCFDAIPDDYKASSEFDQSVLHYYAHVPILLPITLKNFGATIVNNVVKLSWEYENAQNFSHFEIERDGKKIGETTNTHFEDSKAIGNVIYRLKMIDNDGSYRYSNSVAIKAGNKDIIQLLQNPVADEIKMSFSGEPITYNISLYSMDGRKVYNTIYRHNGNTSFTSFKIPYLNAGTYKLMANSKGFTILIKD